MSLYGVPKSIARPEQFPCHFLHEEIAGSQTGCKFKSQPHEGQQRTCLGTEGSHTGLPRARAATNALSYPAWISEESPPLPFTSGLKGLHYCSTPSICYLQTPWGPRRRPPLFPGLSISKKPLWFSLLDLLFEPRNFSFLKFSYPYKIIFLYTKICKRGLPRDPVVKTLLPLQEAWV